MKEIELKTGETIIIRKPNPEDAKDMVKYLNAIGGESDFLLFGKNEFRLSEEQERQYIENISREETSLMLLALLDGTISGIAVLNAGMRKRIAHTCDISLSVAKRLWGRGIGTVLMQELISFARGTGKLKVVHLSVQAGNERARALYKKLGFEEIGVYRDAIRINGKSYDSVLMNLYL